MDERPGLGAFVGDVHAAILQALGCVGYATNGIGARRRRGPRRSGSSCFAAGVAVSHAFAHIVDFGGPVEVGGLRRRDRRHSVRRRAGLQSVPPSIVDQIPDAVDGMQTQEEQVIAFCRSPQFSIDGLRALVRDLG